MKKSLKICIKISIPILVGIALFWLVFKSINFAEVIGLVKKTNPLLIITYFIVSILLILCNVFRWHLILKSQNNKISFIYLIKAFLAGYGVSYITPSAKLGGEPVRAGFLIKKGVKSSQAFSSIFIDKTLELGGSLFFFLIGGLLLIANYSLPQNLKFLLIIISVAIVAVLTFAIYRIINERGFLSSVFSFFKLHKFKKMANFIKKTIDTEKLMIKFYKKDRKDFYLATLVMLLAWVFMFIEFKLAMLIFGYNGNLLQIFLTFSVVGMAYIIPVPFAMGTLEGGQAALYKAISLNPAIGVGVGLITRIRDSLTAAIGLIIAGYYGLFGKKEFRKAEGLDE